MRVEEAALLEVLVVVAVVVGRTYHSEEGMEAEPAPRGELGHLEHSSPSSEPL